MIKKLLVASLLSVSLPSVALAAHPMCGETELSNIMGDMQGNMKAIKKSMKSGDIEALNATAKQLLENVRKSDSLVPLAITDKAQLTAAQQADFDKYQKGMATLEKAIVELINAEDDKARKAALGKIGKSAKQGHKAYKMDCDD